MKCSSPDTGEFIVSEAYAAFEGWLGRHSDLLEDFSLVEMIEVYHLVDGKDEMRPILKAALDVVRCGAAQRPAICPHDGGFDAELGPLGCRLVGQELECVCEHMRFENRGSASSTQQSPREAALEAAALDFIAKVDRGEARSERSYAAFKAALGALP
jgi:hypothetical protein